MIDKILRAADEVVVTFTDKPSFRFKGPRAWLLFAESIISMEFWAETSVAQCRELDAARKQGEKPKTDIFGQPIIESGEPVVKDAS